MVRLLWMLSWLPVVLPAVGELPKPVDLAFTSGGFSHVLKWKPGAGTPADAAYSVSIMTERGMSEDVVPGCRRVQHRLLCDVTEAFSDPMETYITAVRAVLDRHVSPPAFSRYKPLDHMDLPLLAVAPCGRDLCVDLQPPVERYRDIYNRLSYRLHVQSDNAQFSTPTHSLRGETLKDLTPGRQYCVSVSVWDTLENTESNHSRPVCASTTAVPSADPWIAAMLSLLMMAAVVVVTFLILTGFLCVRGRSLPSVLASIRHTDENLAAASRTSFSSLWNVKPCDTEKRSWPPSPDGSDEECVAEDTGPSSASAYMLEGGRGEESFLSSSSSQPQPPHTQSCTQSSTQSSTQHSQRFASAPRGLCSKEEEEEEEEEGSQDVNLLSLRLGWFEDLENQERLSLPEEEPPASPAPLSPGCYTRGGALGGALGGASDRTPGFTPEDEPDSDSGYMPHPKPSPGLGAPSR